MTPPAPLTPGTLFAGRYQILRCLAAGGMGAVYEALHLETNRRRALKVMLPHLFKSEELRERFKREARIAAEIDSEHIVDVSDAGLDEATQMPFLVMELLRGEELGDRLRAVGRFEPDEALLYLRQTALALDQTHAASIVHRDLKPENLFLTRRADGTPHIKILDFGIAKLVRDGATAAGQTQSLGTPLYMAPEQMRAGSKLSPAADIYALGLMAYTMLVGTPYWMKDFTSAGDVIAFVMLALQGPPEPASRRAAGSGVALPAGFDPWFARCTAVDPGARFPSAGAAVQALAEVFAQAPARPAMPLPTARDQLATASTAPQFSPPPEPPRAAPIVTTTSAAVTQVRRKDGQRPIIFASSAAAIGVLGVAAWLGMDLMRGKAAALPSAALPLSTVASAPPVPVPPPSAPIVEPAPAPPASSSAAPPASASARPAPPAKTPTRPPAKRPIFGQD